MKSAVKWLGVFSILCFALFSAPGVFAQQQENEAEKQGNTAVNAEAKQYYDRGNFELQTGNFGDALDFFEKAIALEPGNTTYRFARGRALFKLGRYKEAEDQFHSLLDAGPKARLVALVELGAVYGHAKSYEKAVDFYSQAIALAPSRANLYLARGDMYVELEQYDKAEEDFSKAASLETGLGPTIDYHRGIMAFKQEDYTQAKAALDRSIEGGAEGALAKAVKDLKEIVVEEEWAHKSWAVRFTTLFMMDDNITLEPVRGPAAGNDEVDYILGLNAAVDWYWINKRDVQGGLSLAFQRRYYRWNPEYDWEAYIGSIFYAWHKDDYYYRLEGQMGRYYSNEEDLINFFAFAPSVTRLFGIRDRVQLSGILEYKVRPAKVDEDKDSVHYVLESNYFHTFRLPRVKDELPVTGRFGLKFEGENFRERGLQPYQLLEFKTGVSFPVIYNIEADLSLSHAWIEYQQGAAWDGGLARRDQRTMLTAKLGRNFGRNYRLDLAYSRVLNDSDLRTGTTDPNEYTRDVLFMMFSAKF